MKKLHRLQDDDGQNFGVANNLFNCVSVVLLEKINEFF